MPSPSFRQYEDAIRTDFARGIATEHSYRPTLKSYVEAVGGPSIGATNEPRRVACGAPDFDVSRDVAPRPLTIGYIETKDIGASLDDIERTEQLQRYRAALPNLILTDYLSFRWYRNGDLAESVRWARLERGSLVVVPGGAEAVEQLFTRFLSQQPPSIRDPRDLADRLASLAHLIRDLVVRSFGSEEASGTLVELRQAFTEVLLPDLKVEDFADMFAQTLAYGLFAARVNHTGDAPFHRQDASHEVPRTNPFLRHLFGLVAGPALDDEPFVGLVDDLAQLLALADIQAILADFGQRTRSEDPIVHFYETFLASYDPALREARGVYFTPEPVVSYIVRSVDHLLRTEFGCDDGLAHVATTEVEAGRTVPRVLVLDPAVGTGTFLYAAINLIREEFRRQGNAGMWQGFVRQHLLPRLFGFELLMAPYAVCHLKLGMQLAGQDLPESERETWAYRFEGDERLGVYLTNSLEEAVPRPELLMASFISDEANAALEVKRELPIMVVIGNPPYSNFGRMNRGQWIRDRLEDYKRGLRERKLNLDDDFIKFIRFAQWRIDRTGAGILAYVSNNTYVDGITHRQMRHHLRDSFDDIYILNLHGNSRKRERAPDGSQDENVFDIKQGVAIGIFVKSPDADSRPARVRQHDLWGDRESKYMRLEATDVSTTDWTEVMPDDEYEFFVPLDPEIGEEYQSYQSIADIMPENGSGFTSQRDALVLGFTKDEVVANIKRYLDARLSNEEIRSSFGIRDFRSYRVAVDRRARQFDETKVVRCLYRPFDERWIYFDRPIVQETQMRYERHMLEPNFGLVTTRQTKDPFGALCADTIVGHKAVAAYDRNNVFPLYLYPEEGGLFQGSSLNAGRTPNLAPAFTSALAERLRLRYRGEGEGDLMRDVGAEDIFAYLYAVLHSNSYRARYERFLAFAFPRVPLTSDLNQFRQLVEFGRVLIELHLLKLSRLGPSAVRYPIPGDNRVEASHPRFFDVGEAAPGEEQPLAEGRIYISRPRRRGSVGGQYFEGVRSDVWGFECGGYQPCERWLKDRRGRSLSQDDLEHVRRMIEAIEETIRVTNEIDDAIPAWPPA